MGPLITEAEWLSATTFGPLLRTASQLSSERKLRLFVCACARFFLPANPHPDLHRGLAVAEQMADGTASLAAIESTRELFGSLTYVSDYEARGFGGENSFAAAFVQDAVSPRVHQATRRAHGRLSDYEADLGLVNAQTVVSWLRDIFGNPFRPVKIDPTWLTLSVIELARTIYDERAFDRLPILADALMDAGCDSEEIIQHCRGEGPHSRGCWVVDLVLGKE